MNQMILYINGFLMYSKQGYLGKKHNFKVLQNTELQE